jgi:RNA polymerase sigma factor (sigma-70 family)
MLVRMTANDLDLLGAFTRDQSQDAFTALVQRHLDLVYCAALRQVRSPQLAEEVAQSVFTDLARNATRLTSDTILTAWLYQVTRRTAINVVRGEARRQLREQIASEMNAMNATAADWTHIEALLDEAMHALDDTDRTAVLLRYFENKSLREVGQTLGTSDDAAQKRVSRAIERLREFFSKRGVAVGASGLAVAISAHAVQAAPVGLAVTISTAAALAGTVIQTSTTIAATKALAMTTLQKTLITATVIVAGVTTPLLMQNHSRLRLRAENESLRQQVEQLALLASENDRLSNLVAQAAKPLSNDDQLRELLRLRGEVGQLRSQITELEKLRAENRQLRAAANSRPATQPQATSQDYFPKDSWVFAGYADPESAFQSSAWAMSKGDVRTMLSSVVPEERARMEKEFAGKPESEIAAHISEDTETIKAFRILKKEALSEDEVILTIFGEGKDETVKLRFKRTGSEWRMAGPAGKK